MMMMTTTAVAAAVMTMMTMMYKRVLAWPRYLALAERCLNFCFAHEWCERKEALSSGMSFCYWMNFCFKGADPTLKDGSGHTAEEYAGSVKIKEFLNDKMETVFKHFIWLKLLLLNRERAYITKLRVSACHSQIPMRWFHWLRTVQINWRARWKKGISDFFWLIFVSLG